jgi:hypothetical protein
MKLDNNFKGMDFLSKLVEGKSDEEYIDKFERNFAFKLV